MTANQQTLFNRVRFGIYRKMGLNQRKRRTIQRSVGYLIESVVRRLRMALGREQHLDVAGHDLVLPPDHRLAYYQRRDPTYDRYASDILAAIAVHAKTVRMVDVGANVGDTALVALTAAENIELVGVEGNPAFASYARRNLAPFAERCELHEAFLGPINGVDAVYRAHGSTGGFQGNATHTADDTTVWLSPPQLLDSMDSADITIWKSDIDGFDIHLLAEYWDSIFNGCEVIWFEYDPMATLGDRADIAKLIGNVGASGRGVLVFDNLGNHMITLDPGSDAAAGMRDLTGWLAAQCEHHVMVRYLDVWVVNEQLWDAAASAARRPNSLTVSEWASSR